MTTDLSIEQTMAELGVSRRWLYALIAKGRLPARQDKAGLHAYWIDAEDIERYKRESRRPERGSDDARRALRSKMRRGDI